MPLGLHAVESSLIKVLPHTAATPVQPEPPLKKPKKREAPPADPGDPQEEEYFDPEGEGRFPAKAFRSDKANAGLHSVRDLLK